MSSIDCRAEAQKTERPAIVSVLQILAVLIAILGGIGALSLDPVAVQLGVLGAALVNAALLWGAGSGIAYLAQVAEQTKPRATPPPADAPRPGVSTEEAVRGMREALGRQ